MSPRRLSGSKSRGTTRRPRSARSRRSCTTRRAPGRRCLLVVDESQNLSVEALEELRMLSNFQLGAHPLLQTLLLGQPEFRRLLAEHASLEQLRQRVIAAHHLERDGAGRDRALCRCTASQCVGWDGNPQFDQRVFAELHDATGGIPRRINQIVSRLLLLGAVEQRTRIDGGDARGGARRDGRRRGLPDGRAAAAASRSRPPPRRSRSSTPSRRAPVRASKIDALLAERDAQIAELQQAVVELSTSEAARRDAAGLEIGARRRSVARARGARCSSRNATIRHTLTMLIDWIEAEGPARAAGLSGRCARERHHLRRAVEPPAAIVNGLSVDVEDWFQVGAFEKRDRARRLGRPADCGSSATSRAILDLFDEADVKATFFTLGWVAQRHPALMRRDRRRAGTNSPATAGTTRACSRIDRAQLRRGHRAAPSAALEDACGRTRHRLSRAELLDRPAHAVGLHGTGRAGLSPIQLAASRRSAHDHYGWRRGAALRLPAAAVERRWSRFRSPPRCSPAGALAAGGGGFFRVLPYAFSRWAIRQVNRREGRPAVFYFHPWEIDPGQPRVRQRAAQVAAAALHQSRAAWRPSCASWSASSPGAGWTCSRIARRRGATRVAGMNAPFAPARGTHPRSPTCASPDEAARIEGFVARNAAARRFTGPPGCARSSAAPANARAGWSRERRGELTGWLPLTRGAFAALRAAAGLERVRGRRRRAWPRVRDRAARCARRPRNWRARLSCAAIELRGGGCAPGDWHVARDSHCGVRGPARRRRRGAAARDPAQAARRSPQGAGNRTSRSTVGTAARPIARRITRSMPKACATSARRCSRAALFDAVLDALDADILTVCASRARRSPACCRSTTAAR